MGVTLSNVPVFQRRAVSVKTSHHPQQFCNKLWINGRIVSREVGCMESSWPRNCRNTTVNLIRIHYHFLHYHWWLRQRKSLWKCPTPSPPMFSWKPWLVPCPLSPSLHQALSVRCRRRLLADGLPRKHHHTPQCMLCSTSTFGISPHLSLVHHNSLKGATGESWEWFVELLVRFPNSQEGRGTWLQNYSPAGFSILKDWNSPRLMQPPEEKMFLTWLYSSLSRVEAGKEQN